MFPALRPASDGPAEVEDPFLTRAEAAAVLGVSERTIYRRLRAGALRPFMKRGERGVLREDVCALKEFANKPEAMPVNGATLAQLRAQIRELQYDLEKCEEILDLRRLPLGLSLPALAAKYRAAIQELGSGIVRGNEWNWAEFLMRLRWDDLEKIASTSGDPHPWRPFWRLVEMLYGAAAEKMADSSLVLRLSAARRCIEILSTLWVMEKCEQRRIAALKHDLLENQPAKK